MKYLIKNGRCVDPASKLDAVRDMLVSDGKIEAVAAKLPASGAAQVIDAKGKIVLPGLVDMHAHWRWPGGDSETVASGSRAALKGGFTGVLMMPNTDPPVDNARTALELAETVKKESLVRAYAACAATKGRQGAELSDFAALKAAGAVAATDDGSCISADDVFRKALKAARHNGLALIDHCEDKKLSANGVMNEGFTAGKLGLRPIARAAEYEMVRRDIEYARGLDAPVHIAHVSCKESCEIIRKAKKTGAPVTAEAAPHHFSLTEEACCGYDTRTKMNPPLRSAEDAAALKDALADGTIDVIATDHAPHGLHDKYVEFDAAAFGIIGHETALSLAVMELIDKKIITWLRLAELMSHAPAKILGIAGGTLAKGAPADITVVDPAVKWIYAASGIESRSRNSPFVDKELCGLATEVFVGGKLMLLGGRIQA
ncbi:MAG: dihydroorotase [Elusimicrobiales bacterium]